MRYFMITPCVWRFFFVYGYLLLSTCGARAGVICSFVDYCGVPHSPRSFPAGGRYSNVESRWAFTGCFCLLFFQFWARTNQQNFFPLCWWCITDKTGSRRRVPPKHDAWRLKTHDWLTRWSERASVLIHKSRRTSRWMHHFFPNDTEIKLTLYLFLQRCHIWK